MTIFESAVAVTGGLKGDIRFTNLSTGTCVHVVDPVDRSPAPVHINKVVVGGNYVAAGGYPWIRMYSLDRLENPPTTFEGHTGNITGILFQCDTKWFVSTGDDAKLRVWDLRAHGYQTGLVHSSVINCATLHPNQGIVIFGDRDGFVNHYDLGMNKVVRQPVLPTSTLGVTALLVDESGTTTCCHNNRNLSIVPDVDTESIEAETDPRLSPLMAPEDAMDDTSPRHALFPPAPMAPLPAQLLSRTISSARANVEPTSVNHETIDLLANPRNIKVTPTDVHPGGYVTSMSPLWRNGCMSDMTLTSSDGYVSVWRRNPNEEQMWEMDCVFRDNENDCAENAWSWDSRFVDPDGRFVLAGYSDGKCKLWDSVRPNAPAIAEYECGSGMGIRSVTVIEASSIDSINRRAR